MKKLVALLAALALVGGVFWFVNNRDAQNNSSSDKLRVVTTNSILENMVEEVAGDRVELHSLVERGNDPHEYEPKPADVSAASNADVLFWNGLNLETGGSGWFKKLTETANKQDGEEVFAVSEDVDAINLTTNKNEVDPHAWLDLENGIKYVEAITDVLKDKDEANADYYEDRADAYIAKLQDLHDDSTERFEDIPENARLLVSSEGAFKYFSEAYGLTATFIWEINTESQGTPEQLKSVLAKINDSEVKALFVESSVSPKAMEQVSKESGLPIASKIFTDSLAPKGDDTGADTYYGMMKWNLDNIHAGLAGEE
jgi:iron/zinc/copper transport system substrate-binding protein